MARASSQSPLTMPFGLLPGSFFRRFLIGPSPLEFAENSLALQFLFKSAKRLIDVVVPDEYLQEMFLPLLGDDARAHP